MEFSVSTRADGPFTVVEVGGEVDVYTAPRLREAVVNAIDAGSTTRHDIALALTPRQAVSASWSVP